MALQGLGTSIPVYTTRKTADGYTMTYSMSAWMPFLALFLVVLNMIVWGVIGLYEAYKVVA